MTNKVIIFVGAGISRSAGIPTYRDENGLWAMNDMKIVCNKGRECDDASYMFYNRFRELLGQIEPSEVHFALRDIQMRLGPDRCLIYSQNIDDLLERAGCRVNKIHGSACESRCVSCGNIEHIGYGTIDSTSTCNKCRHGLRNNIVYYGERGDYEQLISDVVDMEDDDILFMIGTSNSSINIDMIIRPLKMKKVYVNPNVEDKYEIKQYHYVINERIEKCLDMIKRIIDENVKDIQRLHKEEHRVLE